MLPNSKFVYAFKIGVLATFVGAIIDMFVDNDLRKFIFNPLFFAFWMLVGYCFNDLLVKIFKH